jgi:hypothetical protein
VTIKEATTTLDNRLRVYSWYLCTGIGKNDDGEDILFVYTQKRINSDLAFLENGWEGFPIVFRHHGKIRPAVKK